MSLSLFMPLTTVQAIDIASYRQQQQWRQQIHSQIQIHLHCATAGSRAANLDNEICNADDKRGKTWFGDVFATVAATATTTATVAAATLVVSSARKSGTDCSNAVASSTSSAIQLQNASNFVATCCCCCRRCCSCSCWCVAFAAAFLFNNF